MAVATPPRMSLADILLNEGLIDGEQHQQAIREYDRTSRSLVRILSDMEVLPEDIRLKILRKSCDCDYVRLDDVTPSAEVAHSITPEVCRRAHAVPLRIVDGSVLVAMEDPTDMRTLQDFERLFGRSIKPVLASSKEIMEAIERMPVSNDAIKRFEEGSSTVGHRLVASSALAVMVFGPMLGFMYFIARSPTGSEWYGGFGFSTFENALVFLIVWGIWGAISYFVTDMIFGSPADS